MLRWGVSGRRVTWNELTAQVGACRVCTGHLAAEANARPLFTKYEPIRPRVLFIAEAPNLDDTVKHGHLTIDGDTDPTGKLLHELIHGALGLRLEDVAFTNAVLCLPKGRAGKYPVTGSLRDACRPHLVSFIEALAPAVVATLGAKALEAAARVERHGLGKMRDAAGRSVSWQGRTLFALAHPSYLGRISRKLEAQREDWRTLRRLLDREA